MPNTSHFQSQAVAIWCGVFFALALVITLVLFIFKRKKTALLTLSAAASIFPFVFAQNMSPVNGDFLFFYSTTEILYALSAAASVLLGVALAFPFFRSYIFGDRTLGNPALATLEKAVTGILDSEMFLTALRSTLPRGEDDPQYGLDYIPYMLHSIDERRKRAVLSARLFFTFTIAAAIICLTVVIYFGYTLVNEAAAGPAKSLADLNRATQETSQTVRMLWPREYYNQYCQHEVLPPLLEVANMQPGTNNAAVHQKFQDAFHTAVRTGNYDELSGTMSLLGRSVSANGVNEGLYASKFWQASNKLTKFINDQDSELANLPTRVADLKALTLKADDALSKPENRTPEIIKRLALGVVISTFCLAILKYLATLYKTRYSQVLEAERDDFAVRRFFVAFKSSQASEEQRKAVLQSFMILASANGAQPKEPADEDTKLGFEIIKEMVQALQKRM